VKKSAENRLTSHRDGVKDKAAGLIVVAYKPERRSIRMDICCCENTEKQQKSNKYKRK
jgi:hypothetical protein